MRSGISSGAIAGISVAGVAGLLLIAGCVYVGLYRNKKVKRIAFSTTEDQSIQGSSRVDFFPHFYYMFSL